MRTLALVLLVAAGAACGGSSTSPPRANSATPTKPQAQPQRASLDPMPIAQYMGHDDATGARVFELLRAGGIESSAGGSLGYSVWVSEGQRAKARDILVAAAARECLEITIFDDQSHVIPGTRPAACPAPPQPAAPVQSAK